MTVLSRTDLNQQNDSNDSCCLLWLRLIVIVVSIQE